MTDVEPVGVSGLYVRDDGEDGCAFFDGAGEETHALTREDMEALWFWLDVRAEWRTRV